MIRIKQTGMKFDTDICGSQSHLKKSDLTLCQQLLDGLP